MTRTPPTSVPSFDAQAGSFKGRAGLPAEVKAAVALAVAELGRLGPGRRLLDIGAGTGELGLEMVRRGFGYTGVDVSPAMLDVFRKDAAAAGLEPHLVVADAALPWPVPPKSAAVVLGSRSLHFLDAAHVAEQAFSAAMPDGACLLVGRVERDPGSPRQHARRAMRDLLVREGLRGRSGRRSAEALVAECVRRGGRHIERRVVASFRVRTSIRASIEAFAGKPGLAGLHLDDLAKLRLLDELTRFTSAAFGNIDTLVESTEHYVLEGATLTESV